MSKADLYLTKALKIAERLGLKGEKGEILMALGKLAIKKGKNEKGLQYYKQAEDLIMNTEIEVNKETFLQEMANVYLSMGKDVVAFNYQTKFRELKKANSLKRNKQKALDLGTKFDADFNQQKQQLEIEKLQLERVGTDKQHIVSGGVILFLCLIIGLLCLGYRKKGKENIQLIKAKEKAEKAAAAKMDFLLTMSHEIRTPMNGVIGMANILMDENPRPDQVKNLEVLKYSANNLLALINDVLDFSKIEANKLELEVTDFSLDKFVYKAYDVFKYTKKKSNVNLILNYDSNGLSHFLKGDTLRLNQILTNLIGNALKFTDKGAVTLHVKVIEYTKAHARVAFAVEDTGIGIPKDKQESIFENFVQASSSTSREYGGTGLGLGITKRFVNLFDSDLVLKSKVGKGSVFSFDIEFPLGEEEKTNATTEVAPKVLPKMAGLRILMAEDNKINQLVAQKLISKWDIQLDIANDGLEAVQMVRNNDYDVILMDIHMPNMNGFEASSAIRKLPAPKGDIPIIAITASAFSIVASEARKNKMNGHLCKPFLSHELHEAITSMLKAKPSLQEA